MQAARCELAAALLDDLRRINAELASAKKKLAAVVAAAGTSLTGLFGVGPVIAAAVIGDVRDVSRFPLVEDYTMSYSAGSRRTCSTGSIALLDQALIRPRGPQRLPPQLRNPVITSAPELLVLRQEVRAAAAEPKPKLDRADRAVIAALATAVPWPAADTTGNAA